MIFYSTDGTAPFNGGPLRCTGDFMVTNTTSIRALAVNLDDFSTASSEMVTVNISPLSPPVPRYALALTSEGGGTVTKSPIASSYLSNSVVTITAIPNPGETLISWAGDATGSNATTTVTMGRPKAVHAIFSFSLTTSVRGNGSLTRDPDLTHYTNGAVVLLSATPAVGSIFTGWSGNASGTINPLSVVMDTNKNITANFVLTNLLPPNITAPPRSQTNWAGNNIILGAAVTASNRYAINGVSTRCR